MTRITAFLISSVPQKTTRICKIEVKENEVTLLQEAQKISKMVLCLGRIFIKKILKSYEESICMTYEKHTM